ncbi:hypothetical protein [Pandoraea pulmonicola]|uniref:Uncharacterized protein n=1 Tax=Pandoraea pulmonicola TaxID=93221 RepID=A0AAJ4ZEE4_PANPU|nr:hypothetical protein [Pandoraea pulmonicola]AJC19943.1 hypothetical protein RO07_04670 [Pandoraea pulmonicola]SUA91827.1 Uncharacterised protein [Pandoraea pulmonicola]
MTHANHVQQIRDMCDTKGLPLVLEGQLVGDVFRVSAKIKFPGDDWFVASGEGGLKPDLASAVEFVYREVKAKVHHEILQRTLRG